MKSDERSSPRWVEHFVRDPQWSGMLVITLMLHNNITLQEWPASDSSKGCSTNAQ